MSVADDVIAKDNVSATGKILCKFHISSHIFCHSMADLDQASEIALIFRCIDLQVHGGVFIV